MKVILSGYLYNCPLEAAIPPKIGGIIYSKAKGIPIIMSMNISKNPIKKKVNINEIKNNNNHTAVYISKLN